MKKAQSLFEYTLILVLISLVAVTTLNFLGKRAAFDTTPSNKDTKQNIVETMSAYCQNKGLQYNAATEQCEEIVNKEAKTSK